MIEKHIVLEDIDPVIFLWRKQRQYADDTSFISQITIVARGNVIKVLGDEEEMCAFEENITKLEKLRRINSLKEEVILDIVKGKFTPNRTDRRM